MIKLTADSLSYCCLKTMGVCWELVGGKMNGTCFIKDFTAETFFIHSFCLAAIYIFKAWSSKAAFFTVFDLHNEFKWRIRIIYLSLCLRRRYRFFLEGVHDMPTQKENDVTIAAFCGSWKNFVPSLGIFRILSLLPHDTEYWIRVKYHTRYSSIWNYSFLLKWDIQSIECQRNCAWVEE